jgi:hypothetical protein
MSSVEEPPEQPGPVGQEPQQTERGAARDRRDDTGNMLPSRQGRGTGLERLLVRLIATCGVVGIGVAIGAIMASSKDKGWEIGLVVAIVSVILSGVLWSSRQL